MSMKCSEEKILEKNRNRFELMLDEIKSMTMDEAKAELEKIKKQKEDMDCFLDYDCCSASSDSREFYLECKIRGDLK